MIQGTESETEKWLMSQRLLECITSSWMSQAVYVFAELCIADHLADRPLTSRELSAITSSHEPSLRRLLRALVTLEICRELEDGSFAVTPMGSLLGSRIEGSLRSWTLWWGAHLWDVWGKLLYSVRTGQSARKHLSGSAGFDFLADDPQAAAVFNRALSELTRLTAESVIRNYDFTGMGRIMDVGGGYGELLICILKAYPALSGVLFDLPHAIGGGRHRLEEAGLSARCDCIEGDFFKAVPRGADTYILKSVIHDWDDKQSVLILSNCRKAVPARGRLLLVERILPEKVEASSMHRDAVRSDLTMLVAHAARERTEKDFRALLASAGFTVEKIIPAGLTVSLIESYPA